jgi:L-threonylcarbamoyladenylate synthase
MPDRSSNPSPDGGGPERPTIPANGELIAEAVACLRRGGVVAFPTETVYGLGADALSPAAVARVFALKGRPTHNPLIVHVTDAAMAARVVDGWTEEAEELARAFWPGPLTLVLPKAPCVPSAVTAHGPTVAVRAPRHPVALTLIDRFGGPIVGPSANRSGRVSPTQAWHVRSEFPLGQAMVLDGGSCEAGIESTVLDLTGSPARVLRPGVIGPEEIAMVLGRPVVVRSPVAPDPGERAEPGTPVSSPGLLGAHYQPEARVVLSRSVLEAREEDALIVPEGVDPPAPVATIVHLPGTAAGFAAGVYAALREADSARPGRIVVVLPAAIDAPGTAAEAAIWSAVLDRLGRAAADR